MSHHHDQSEIEDRLWKEMDKGRFGMLGLTGDKTQHFQPMTMFAERESGQVWFYTRSDTDLARGARDGAEAMLIVVSKDQEMQACIAGRLVHDQDRQRIEKYWGPMVAAWFPEGKDDPRLTMLRFDCRDAEVWLTEAGPVKYAWEVARANQAGRMPDLGDKASLNLN